MHCTTSSISYRCNTYMPVSSCTPLPCAHASTAGYDMCPVIILSQFRYLSLDHTSVLSFITFHFFSFITLTAFYLSSVAWHHSYSHVVLCSFIRFVRFQYIILSAAIVRSHTHTRMAILTLYADTSFLLLFLCLFLMNRCHFHYSCMIPCACAC